MSTTKFWRIMMSMMAAVLVLASGAGAVSAATEIAPVAQELRAQEVTGTIPGGQFAKIWLGLEPITPNETITLVSEWDRLDPGANGLGFYVLTDEQLAAVQNGTNVRDSNLATGSRLSPESPANEVGAEFQATSEFFTLVVFNDSNQDANFKITSENATITDESGEQVTAPGADEEDAEDAPVEAGEEAGEEEATEAEATEAGEEVTEVVEAETPAETEAEAEEAETPETEVAEEPEEEAAPVTITTPGVVEAQELEGELPLKDSKHFLGLEPSVRDGTMSLVMSFNPQDSSELASRIGFWVLDQDAFNRYLNPNENVVLSQVAIAAGSGDQPGLAANERSGSFTASGFGPYTVVVYNDSDIPATYTLRVDGGILIDDSGQTLTASMSMDEGVETEEVAESEEGEAAAAEETESAEAGDESAEAAPGREGEPGGTYTVQAGDTLSLIARDIYGEVGLWEELCSFNNLDDCNILEVGDVLQLPTTDQIGTGATAPAAATPEPAAAPETDAPETAAEETPEAETPAAAEAETAVEESEPVTATTEVTSTTEVTATEEMTDTADEGTDEASSEATVDIMTLLEGQGNFTILVDALEASGLDEGFEKTGPFTIFAPTDAAFEALGTETIESLMSQPTGQLVKILLYHVLTEPALVLSEDITDGMTAATQEGMNVGFEVNPDGIDGVKVQDSLIIASDLLATNGVVHAIDKVMFPADLYE